MSTVQEICDSLQEQKKTAAAFAVTGEGFQKPQVLEEASTTKFLAESVLKINDLLNNKGVQDGDEFQGGENRQNYASEGAFIAQLQANALLSAYQRAAGLVQTSRAARLASKYTRTTVNARDYGPLGGQLRDIGVKADYDFAAFVIPEEAEQ